MWTPCRDCPMQGCGSYHDVCEEYIKYKQERQRYLDAKYLDSLELGIVKQAVKSMKKHRKKRH